MPLFLKYYFRYLIKNRTVSLVSFVGLTIAIASATVIFIYYTFECSYDKYNENYSNIYRLRIDTYNKGKLDFGGYNVNPPSGYTLKKALPEVKEYARIFPYREVIFSYNDNSFEEENVFFADSSIFNVFTFHFLKGDKNTALKMPRTAVITKTSAVKYFGTTDPIGKALKYGENVSYQITGVIDDIPENSHLRINMLLSYNSFENNAFRYQENRWDRYWCYTYLLVEKGTNIAQLEKKANNIFNEHKPITVVSSWIHTLQPMKDFHLFSKNDRIGITGSGEIVKLIIIIALLILLIAYINQANISVAQSIERIKTVALSHVIGGRARSSIVLQFIIESVLITITSFITAIILCVLLGPAFSSLFHFKFSISILSITEWLLYFVGLLIVAVLTGIYPALVVLSHNINECLKSKVKHAGVNLYFRKGLLVFQYSITCCLIVGALVIYLQKEYMLHKDMGLEIGNTIVIKGTLLDTQDSITKARISLFKNELKNYPQISEITSSNALPGYGNYSDGTISDIQQFSDMVLHVYYHVDYNFIKSFNINLLSGRIFSKDFPSDVTSSAIINEKSLKTLGFRNSEEALGHVITREYDRRKVKIIGVVKDFHIGTLSLEIPPMVLMLYPDENRFYSVKYSGADVQSALKILEQKWNVAFPSEKFTYFILADNFKKQYEGVENYGVILGLFSSLAILLSCFGLFGLSFYTIVQRTKEIGIRKINGASITTISEVLFADFAKIILMAFVISCPIAYYLANKWIEEFAYRISLTWWIFVSAGVITIMVALLTVSWQLYQASIRNPVETLRYE